MLMEAVWFQDLPPLIPQMWPLSSYFGLLNMLSAFCCGSLSKVYCRACLSDQISLMLKLAYNNLSIVEPVPWPAVGMKQDVDTCYLPLVTLLKFLFELGYMLKILVWTRIYVSNKNSRA